MPKYLKLIDRPTFTFTPAAYPDVALKYRRITVEVLETINARHRQTRMANGARETYLPDESLAERAHELFEWAVVDWTGVVDEQDQAVPCTPDTKRLFEKLFPDTRQALVVAAQSDVLTEPETVRPS
jgi:hypothetical protein